MDPPLPKLRRGKRTNTNHQMVGLFIESKDYVAGNLPSPGFGVAGTPAFTAL
jgi:hypothetical protein